MMLCGRAGGGGAEGGRGVCLVSDCSYELIQGWLRHSPAVALFSGTISSMGRRKWVKWPASSCDQPYFSTSTSNRDHGFSLVMCRSSPAGGNGEQSHWPHIGWVSKGGGGRFTQILAGFLTWWVVIICFLCVFRKENPKKRQTLAMHGPYHRYCYILNLAYVYNCFLGLNYCPKTTKNIQISYTDDMADMFLYNAV